MWLQWYRSCDRWNFTAQEGKLYRGKWHFAAAEAGLSKNVRYFAVLKFHKRYFMTVEYHQRNFSTVKSGSHCGAFQGRPSLTLSLSPRGAKRSFFEGTEVTKFQLRPAQHCDTHHGPP